jgi:hypothetical protein
MASKKIFTDRDSKNAMSITRMFERRMLFEITSLVGDTPQKTQIILESADLSDLQRDLYAYLNFSKHA